ncbi:MAG: hypothetical protein DMG03_01980 [Acidobacteria bacterium]|nr:MAG: hypothetical protein DMG03_01980 [Acidobacteriota bacterium]
MPPPNETLVPGIMIPTAWMLRPVGIASSTSRVITVRVVMFCTSTTGDSAATVIVSSTAPIFISALIVAVKSEVNSTFSRFTTLKPGSVKVTV